MSVVVFPGGQDWPAREDSRVLFTQFLKTLEHKSWYEALGLIDKECRNFGLEQPRYFGRLLRLRSYLRYPSTKMPKEYRLVLMTIRELPELLVEKLTEAPVVNVALAAIHVAGTSAFEQFLPI